MAARQITGKKPKNFWFTFRTLLAYMGRHKFLFLAVAVLVTVSALGNLLGTYMIRPVVNSVGAGDVDALARGVLATAAICGVGALAAFGYTQTMVYAAQQVLYDIRRDLFAHIQSLPLRFFDTQLHGDIMSYFTNDVDTVADALNNSFAMTIQSQQAALGDVNGYIEEMVSGQKVVKVFNHEPANLRVFQAKNEALRQAGTGAQSYAATMVPAVVSISYINYAIVAVVGYLVFVRQAAMPINQFTQQSNFLLAAMAGAERIFEAMRLPPEVDEGRIRLVNTRGEGVTLTACAEKTGRWAWQKPDGSLVPLRGDVRFHDVTFGYEKGRPILQNISLYAKPGQKIAFVGSTGAGKTTITNLINRFYDIDAGSVTYDGIDVRDIAKDSLRQSLGIVLQDTHLFTGTIADNIRFGKLDATREEIVRAARIANADSFIRRLPQGYDTRITSDGASLSQGQRQLLAIARAAVADPPVLILDEATSSIDTRTEALIEKGMDQLMEGRTVFVIAHRLSTVRNANAIIVLEHGQVVERGDHDALLAQKGEYYQLYNGMFELS